MVYGHLQCFLYNLLLPSKFILILSAYFPINIQFIFFTEIYLILFSDFIRFISFNKNFLFALIKSFTFPILMTVFSQVCSTLISQHIQKRLKISHSTNHQPRVPWIFQPQRSNGVPRVSSKEKIASIPREKILFVAKVPIARSGTNLFVRDEESRWVKVLSN